MPNPKTTKTSSRLSWNTNSVLTIYPFLHITPFVSRYWLSIACSCHAVCELLDSKQLGLFSATKLRSVSDNPRLLWNPNFNLHNIKGRSFLLSPFPIKSNSSIRTPLTLPYSRSSFKTSHIMSKTMSKTTNHCSFAATVEIVDCQRVLYGNTIILPATLQGPHHRSIPDLHFMEDIPVEIEYYNGNNDVFVLGSVIICFGTISFQEQNTGCPTLTIKASALNVYVSVVRISKSTFPFSYSRSVDALPMITISTPFLPWWTLRLTSLVLLIRLRKKKMTIASSLWASLSTLERTRRASNTTLSLPFVSCPQEINGNALSLDLAVPSKSKVTSIPLCFICQRFRLIDCSLGDLVGFYSLRSRFSPCVLLHTLSYITSPTSDIAKPSAPTLTTPRKRRLGEPPTLTSRHVVASTETSLLEVDEPDPPPSKIKSSRASKTLGKASAI